MRLSELENSFMSGTFIPFNHDTCTQVGSRFERTPDGFRLFEYCCFVKGFDVTGEEPVASAATIEDSIEVVSSNFGHDPSMDTNPLLDGCNFLDES